MVAESLVLVRTVVECSLTVPFVVADQIEECPVVEVVAFPVEEFPEAFDPADIALVVP